MNRIQSVRESKGLKQAELAQKAGISTVTLSRYENSKRSPQYDDLKNIAAVLETSVAYLMCETETTNGNIQQNLIGTNPNASDTNDSAVTLNGKKIADKRTPSKILRAIADLNDELAETAGTFTESEARSAETLLHLCLENFETSGAASQKEETA